MDQLPTPPRLDDTDDDAGDPTRAPAGVVLLETAWEVCNQVGGIYQVLRSKAPTMVERWRNRYYLIGPYVEAKAPTEFEPRQSTGWTAKVIERLKREGLVVHHGRWEVSSRPRVLLLDHALPTRRLDEVKYRLWKDHGIESPGNDPLIDGVLSFSYAVFRLIRAITEELATAGQGPRRDRHLLCHFHEWMGAAAIPMIRRENLPVSVVFTTHATILGRYIASSHDDLYERLHQTDHEAEAAHFGIKTQHGIERACAHGSHVFTTVSPITGEECGALLGKPVDMVLPNGLNVDRYSVGHDFQTLHAHFKEAIHRFVMGHFFPSYSFDLSNTVYAFTSGRFEPRNKGFDLCLEAMAKLNMELRTSASATTVVFFIVTSRPTRSLHPRSLESRGVLNELREVCTRITRDLGEELFRRAAAGQRVKLDELVDEYWALRFRRTQHALRTDRLPLNLTHVLEDEATDPVVRQIQALGLVNNPDDPVKVIYHPEFITPVNPLWGIEYEQFVRGCHIGVFPSAYEPWGYTPLECVCLGVPAITSDLAGFGRYVAEMHPDHDEWGMRIVRRRSQTRTGSVDDLVRYLLEFCRLDRRGRVTVRNEVEQRSWLFDWQALGLNYHKAHDLALTRAGMVV